MNKRLLIGIAIVGSMFLLSACAPETTETTISQQGLLEEQIPEPTGYVVDTSNVIGNETEEALKVKLKEFDQKAQIAVVTVPTTGNMDEKDYAIKLAEKWKVGHEGVDNGVIFLIVTGDRKLRIEVGRGLEDKITDGEAGRILDNSVVPELKNNNWEKGIINGVDAIMKEAQ